MLDLVTARQQAYRMLHEGDTVGAAGTLDSALGALSVGGDNAASHLFSREAADAYSDCAALHYTLGDYEGAIQRIRRACAIVQGDGEVKSQLLRNLGVILHAARRFPEAARAYEEALVLDRASEVGAKHLVRDLVDLGDVYHALADGETARRLFNEAHHLMQEAEANPVEIANVSNRLGKLEISIGENPERAEEHFSDAFRISCSLSDRSAQVVALKATALYNLALVARERHDLVQAERLQRQALDLYALYDPESVPAAQAAGFLGLICWKRGSSRRAIQHYRQSVALIRSHVYGCGPSPRQAILSQHHSPYRDLVACLEESQELDIMEGYRLAEELRARTVADIWSERRLRLSHTPPTDEMVLLQRERAARERYGKAHREMVRLWISGEAGPERIQQVEASEEDCKRDLTSLDKEMRATAPALDRWQRAQGSPLEEVQACLGHDELLLQYLVAHDATFLWVVRSDSSDVERLDVGQARLRTLIDRSLGGAAAIGDGEHGEHELTYLSDVLLGGIPDRAWRDVRKVVIVPDLDLWRLPFEGLTLPGSADTFGEAFETVYVPSGRALILLNEAPRREGAVTANQCMEVGLLPLGSGPTAERTKAATSTGWTHDFERVGIHEGSSFAKELFGARYVHVSTPTVVFDRDPLQSGLSSGPDEKDIDGFVMRLPDLSSEPLRCDVVTLSSVRVLPCRGFEGDGLVALTQTFFQAGVRNVLLPLLPQQGDGADTSVVQAFYERVLAGASPAAALREARRAMHSEGAHPLECGRYVLVGRGR